MTDLQTKVRATIEKRAMLAPGERVLVAVSGGPDSVALLHLLFSLKEDLGLHLEVAHLQHGIRGEEAREDALFVGRLAKRLELPCHLRDVELLRLRADRGKGNLEAMARKERYRFLTSVSREHRLPKIATGHTRDDQVETLLMWLLRGAGRRGLSGIPAVISMKPGGPLLVRPLIETSKAEVIEYLTAQGLDYRTDRSNLDPGPWRNRIRLRLLPQLREQIDASLDERLAHTAEVLSAEDEILEEMAREHLQGASSEGTLLREFFLHEKKAIQRRALRRWIGGIAGDLRRISFHHIEKALQLIAEGPPQGSLSLPKGWRLIRNYELLGLSRRGREEKAVCYSYTLPLEGDLVIAEAGIKVHTSRPPFLPDARPQDDQEALFDLSALTEKLSVRNFRAGDRFQPLGMRGHKKIKDLFIEKKVPLSVRRTLPLLLAGDKILWIPRYGRSEIAKVGPETTEVIKVRVVAD